MSFGASDYSRGVAWAKDRLRQGHDPYDIRELAELIYCFGFQLGVETALGGSWSEHLDAHL